MFLVSIYAVLGMAIGFFVKNPSTSLLVSSFVMIINMFVAGIIYPVERMASFMVPVAKAIPFTSGISMLQQSIFYGISLSLMKQQVLILSLILIGSIVLLLVARKIFIVRTLKNGWFVTTSKEIFIK